MNRLKSSLSKNFILLLSISLIGILTGFKTNEGPTIEIEFQREHYKEDLNVRLIVLITDQIDTEPRFQLLDNHKTCQGFSKTKEYIKHYKSLNCKNTKLSCNTF